MGHPLRRVVSMEPRLPIWLTHLWQRRIEHERLGVVFGAGVSHDAGVPMWEELIERLAVAAKVPKDRMALHKQARFPETFLAEILFRKHCTEEEKASNHLTSKYRGYHLNSTWRDKIRKCLYQNIKATDFLEITKAHAYLSALAKLICDARFAVTFNFDDIVDEAVIGCAARSNMPNPEVTLIVAGRFVSGSKRMFVLCFRSVTILWWSVPCVGRSETFTKYRNGFGVGGGSSIERICRTCVLLGGTGLNDRAGMGSQPL
jgi:hypothetical protein